MPRKRARSPSGAASGAAAGAAQDKARSDVDDDDFLFDETQSLSGRSSQEPQHRNAANARERARMRVLSKAFCRLKTTLPWVPADTKLSKLDTLRLAASYIAHLRALLQDEPRAAAQLFPHPLNLAWPFAFQHGGAPGGQCSTSPRSGWSPAQSESPSPRTGGDTSRENINMSTENINMSRENLNLPRDNVNMSRDTLISRGNVNCQNPNVRDFTGSCYSNEMAGNDTHCDSNIQYCNSYAYRDGYYELRNAYSDSLLNNLQ